MSFAIVLLVFYLYASVRPVPIRRPDILKSGWVGFFMILLAELLDLFCTRWVLTVADVMSVVGIAWALLCVVMSVDLMRLNEKTHETISNEKADDIME